MKKTMVYNKRRRWAPLGIATVVVLFCAHGQAQVPVSKLVGNTKHLVLDSRVIDKTDGVQLVLGKVEKEPRNPLFQADKPWENSLNNLYPNVIYDEEHKLFKLWYKCVIVDKDLIAKMRKPSLIHRNGWFLCYATSTDGIVWKKPALGVCEFDGSTKTNAVVEGVANAGVFKDPADPNPARRYKLIYDVGFSKLRARFSADGIHWSDPLLPKGLVVASGNGTTGDTHNNAFWDNRLGKYILITRIYRGQRMVARSSSDDFLNWEEPKIVLHSTPEEDRKRQTYCMSAFPYANVYLGFVMMYNAGTDQTVDCELAWSPDSVQWHRIKPGESFIPRGSQPGYDSGCIYAQAGSPTVWNNRMFIFYGGSREVHKGWKRHCLPCLAYLRCDGFAGYRPIRSGETGTIITRPLVCDGNPIRVSADAENGSLRVSVLEADGFGLDDCEPITHNVTDGVVIWKRGKDPSSLKGKTVRLKFELNSAVLYAFSGLTGPD
ncbi:MAG: hypothetical protein JXM70_27330 [Pirellulales bacterium]|nr:hypothetical protein [Pirellulales bacterium]